MYAVLAVLSASVHDNLILILILGSVIGLTLTAEIRQRLKKKRKKQEKQYHKATHVRTVTLTDPIRFGTIEAEFDDETGILTADQVSLPKFGNQEPSLLEVEGYREDDQETILRLLGIAYEQKDEILIKMAEQVLTESQFDQVKERVEIADVAEQIAVTDFQFLSGEELMTMQINAGVEIGNNAYSLTAMYYSNPVRWKYEATKMPGAV